MRMQPLNTSMADAEDEIRQAITHHERSMADLQIEMEALKQGIRGIQLQMREHEKEIWFLKGKITLARRLPPEILVSIFEFCTLGRWTRAPLVVSHVCSEWRRAAQAPSIWSQVYVNVDSLDPYRRTRLWLNKSQNVPIDITVDLHNYTTSTSRTMDLLLSHRSRWRSFTLFSFHLAPANDILHRCAGDYHNLQTLCVFIEEEFGTTDGIVGEDAALHSLRTTFNGSPSLRSYIITRNVLVGSDIPSSITNLSINLDGLSTISLTITILQDILTGLPLLEEFYISLSRAKSTSFLPSVDVERPTTLSALKVMTLIGQPDLFTLLQNIHTPSLRQLHLLSSAEPIPVSHQWSGLTLLQWLNLGNTSLELLELRDVDVAQDIFIACFKSLTKLRTLKLHDSEISDTVFESLHGDQSCPNLTVVDLRWCSVVTGSALVRFVKSRLETGAMPMEVITVINCSFVEERDILNLAQYTICRLVIDSKDYCRNTGCCENGRYRNRLKLRGFGIAANEKQRRRMIL
ncbi:hypothetical protein GGU11DRAFT_700261 [Lentinula aff. detonsa]|nr:hypothetical protein GGU11DRAFT_700261 [Lentinula aff. detonsa]